MASISYISGLTEIRAYCTSFLSYINNLCISYINLSYYLILLLSVYKLIVSIRIIAYAFCLET